MPDIPTADHDPVFHAGERALQTRAGSREWLAQVGARIMRNEMPEQHRAFFAELPFLVVGTVDAACQPWASLLAGPPGFLRSPDARHLDVAAAPLWGDVLHDTLAQGAPIGLLGIAPHTRRRNRMNGTVHGLRPDGFTVEVGQSFGNCPKYMQPREARYVESLPPSPRLVRADRLDEAGRRIVAQADTFFIATAASGAHAAGGVDVSHRGGAPGFVRVQPDGSLLVPDYPGNQFFNTLGNLHLDPRAGLLFVDVETGALLQLAVTAELLWADAASFAATGIERALHLRVRAQRLIEGALPLQWRSV
ncbi:pyridoxamine 5'-phosphate oxidase family protein [Pseudorhodoferax sp. Leaf267]|uniref:pyridoxamine 5'-phosphate oxidase family protein n=1 Tax=Pseudorhodoferax sp. Leaf267 TaxID=1736316 RepID=UPI0006FB650B|nr:pyridoxamine 5'-phosphate oxidase family protein [Pseudorhodoferax sp. Leaf267]KQP12850.1 pyridoxamine 5'-phosphate oxidase [Pseudorhodoferax sp. Leaf267]